jgi:exoribonuclease R
MVEDREYNKWYCCNANSFEKLEVSIDPLSNKLFNNDIFQISKNLETTIVHSGIRSGGFIPGVIILKDNKTYGRKNGKLLYKCIPDDIRIPIFLIPYEIKQLGFSKVNINKYVTFVFEDWDHKHPQGILYQVVGNVDILDNYYEYQLYCKSLHSSIQKFTKDTSYALKHKSYEMSIENVKLKYPNIMDRTDKTNWDIFTIDGPTTVDFDDAFSIKPLNNGDEDILLSIYISNVTLCLDVFQLWNSFSQRISTIYLPDRKRPMLPTTLSEGLCSLQANTTRIAFVMDIIISSDYTIRDIKYSNCFININKNFIYDENDLLNNKTYQYLYSVVQHLLPNYKYIKVVKNSNDLVSYLMILMNYHCSKNMIQHNNGIFRSSIINDNNNNNENKTNLFPSTIPDEVENFIKVWNSSICQYIDGRSIQSEFKHQLLDIDSYIHITSPIRRLVDLLNIIQFQINNNMIQLSKEASLFYEKWINQLDYINVTMRAIRKVQNDSSLLDLCNNDPSVMNQIYEGYSFDKLDRSDGLFQYIVYLPKLKLVSKITSRINLLKYDKQMYKLFLFHDEDRFKKKIRLQLV